MFLTDHCLCLYDLLLFYFFCPHIAIHLYRTCLAFHHNTLPDAPISSLPLDPFMVELLGSAVGGEKPIGPRQA